MSPLPEPVELAGYQAIARKTLPYEILPKDFFEPVSKLKSLFAQLIHADDAERIALVPSVSYGIGTVVKNVKLVAGQNIVLADEIFPSNYYAWQRLAAERGGSVKVVKRPEIVEGRGRAWNERILEAIDDQTIAVSLPHVHWTDGTLFNLKMIRARTNEVGALLIVDGTQSVGALPFDVNEIRPDALVCAGYKWLLGPYTSGLAYFSERFDNGIPLEESWMNRKDSEHFEKLTEYQEEYKPAAYRYNMGESSQFVAVPMLTAAIELLLQWGVDNIQSYCANLTAPYFELLKELGFEIELPDSRAAHLAGLRMPTNISLDGIKKATLENSVFVSYRAGAMRVSTHLFNEPKDFERLLHAVKAVVK